MKYPFVYSFASQRCEFLSSLRCCQKLSLICISLKIGRLMYMYIILVNLIAYTYVIKKKKKKNKHIFSHLAQYVFCVKKFNDLSIKICIYVVNEDRVF